MKRAETGFFTEVFHDCIPNDRQILKYPGKIVVFRPMKRVFPIIAQIKHHHFKAIQQMPPKWKIGVGGKAVTVTDHDTHIPGFAMGADFYHRTVIHHGIKSRARRRNDEVGQVISVHWKYCRAAYAKSRPS